MLRSRPTRSTRSAALPRPPSVSAGKARQPRLDDAAPQRPARIQRGGRVLGYHLNAQGSRELGGRGRAGEFGAVYGDAALGDPGRGRKWRARRWFSTGTDLPINASVRPRAMSNDTPATAATLQRCRPTRKLIREVADLHQRPRILRAGCSTRGVDDVARRCSGRARVGCLPTAHQPAGRQLHQKSSCGAAHSGFRPSRSAVEAGSRWARLFSRNGGLPECRDARAPISFRVRHAANQTLRIRMRRRPQQRGRLADFFADLPGIGDGDAVAQPRKPHPDRG